MIPQWLMDEFFDIPHEVVVNLFPPKSENNRDKLKWAGDIDLPEKTYCLASYYSSRDNAEQVVEAVYDKILADMYDEDTYPCHIDCWDLEHRLIPYWNKKWKKMKNKKMKNKGEI